MCCVQDDDLREGFAIGWRRKLTRASKALNKHIVAKSTAKLSADKAWLAVGQGWAAHDETDATQRAAAVTAFSVVINAAVAASVYADSV